VPALCPALIFVAFAACSSSNTHDADVETGDLAEAGASDAAEASTVDAADSGSSQDASGNASDAADAGPSALRVLFIGNSYTYVNDLPGMLGKIAASSGVAPTITTDEVVEGSATLEVHWTNAIAQGKIQQGQWTHVVLQGQSLEAAADSSSFFAYAQKFGDLIVDAGARPTLFVTWARAAGDLSYSPQYGSFVASAQMQDVITVAYAKVAKKWPQSILACAGEAFKRSIAKYPDIVLQQSDFSHPTVAGTYLAASTFYVALTGKPVPVQSEVPEGVSAQDAAKLRDIALVGSNCADVQVKGVIGGSLGKDTDGGPPYDFGTAGSAVSRTFTLKNTGGMTVGIKDGMSLVPPFVWTAGDSYPGGSGPDFCSNSLAPGSSCTISITYTGASSADGSLTLNLTDSYLPTVTRTLRGTTTQRALLSVHDTPDFNGCTSTCGAASVPAFVPCQDTCGVSSLSALANETKTLTLFVANQGALPVTSIGDGSPLASPFGWAGGSFPGGVGSVTYNGTTFPYCSGATLGVGKQCAVTLSFSPTAVGSYSSSVNLAYSDNMGTVTPNATRNIVGSCVSSQY
jgi:hypothetical protein